MKIGIVDVGGGYRGIYGAGVLDYCMDNDIKFDVAIGVSAGSVNLLSYAAWQDRRNYQFYTEYGQRKECTSAKNLIEKKAIIDLDYVYSDISNSDGENPLDYEAAQNNPMEFYAVATDANTGEAAYFGKYDIKQDHYDALKASSALPIVSHPYEIGNSLYFDGTLSDPVPIKKAFDLGCDKVVLILTKPLGDLEVTPIDEGVSTVIYKKYPKVSIDMYTRILKYNKCVEDAMQLEEEGKLLIIAPDDTCGVSTLTKDKELLNNLYEKGYRNARKISEFIK